MTRIIKTVTADELEKSGGSFNVKTLQNQLGISVFFVDARDRSSCLNVLDKFDHDI